MKDINTLEELNAFIGQSDRALVKVGTPYCGACSVLHNTLVSIENDAHPWEIAEINADVCDDDLVESLDVDDIPLLLYYIKGKVVDRSVGFVPAETILGKFVTLPVE